MLVVGALVAACGSEALSDGPRGNFAGTGGIAGSAQAGSGSASAADSGGGGSGGGSGANVDAGSDDATDAFNATDADAAARAVDSARADVDVHDAALDALDSTNADATDTGTDSAADVQPEATACVCSSGPCCDGCRFRNWDHVCGEALYETRCRVTEGCRAREDGYRASACNGDAAECTRWGGVTFKWVSHGCGTC